jgi:hypothetical protein
MLLRGGTIVKESDYPIWGMWTFGKAHMRPVDVPRIWLHSDSLALIG